MTVTSHDTKPRKKLAVLGTKTQPQIEPICSRGSKHTVITDEEIHGRRRTYERKEGASEGLKARDWFGSVDDVLSCAEPIMKNVGHEP